MDGSPFNVGVKHPLVLESQEGEMFDNVVWVHAVDTSGNQVSIGASRERWIEALQPRYGPRPSADEVARRMYIRDEIEVEDFERVLDCSLASR